MKYRKERDFVKEVNEALKEEVIVSRINILESSSEGGKVTGVLYVDRFGKQYDVYMNKTGDFTKKLIK